jgi:AP endonuclease-2
MRSRVIVNNTETHILDLMNPIGTFKNGQRLREPDAKDLLPLSAKLLPEFDRRRSIKDMFRRQKSTAREQSAVTSSAEKTATPFQRYSATDTKESQQINFRDRLANDSVVGGHDGAKSPSTQGLDQHMGPPPKRLKSSSSAKERKSTNVTQTTLANFLKPNHASATVSQSPSEAPIAKKIHLATQPGQLDNHDRQNELPQDRRRMVEPDSTRLGQRSNLELPVPQAPLAETVDSDFATRLEWTKLFSRRGPPRCEGHDEPCICLETKKKGINCGRKFYICPR